MAVPGTLTHVLEVAAAVAAAADAHQAAITAAAADVSRETSPAAGQTATP